MAHDPKSTLIDIYDAWRAHDLDWLGSYLPADFSHSVNIPVEQLSLSGVREGKVAVLDRLREVFDAFDTQHFEPGKLIVNDRRATADVAIHCRHRSSGAWLHSKKTHVWRLENGWPVALTELYDLDDIAVFVKSMRG